MAKLLERLQSRKVETLKEPGLYADGGNLYLRIDPSGARRWTFIYRWHGKRKEMGIGPLHTLSLSEARERARSARKLLLDGHSPLEEKRRQRAAQATVTFGEFADEQRETAERGWKGKAHKQQAKLIIETYCKPIRDLPINRVDTDDIVNLLKPIWTEKPETAARVRARIEWVLNAAKAKQLRAGDNPARLDGHLELLLPEQPRGKRGHHKAVPYEKIPDVFRALAKSGGIGARALEFTILTAARTNETIGAAALEFDLNAAVWTLSPARMKATREHRVPLTDKALHIVKELWPKENAGYIFRSLGRHGKHLSNMAMSNVLHDYGYADYTVHGFRSSFKDWATDETEFAREVIEAALAHKMGDATEQAYRRRDALEKRRKLMAAWEKYCLGK